jgi:hypothetical protein
VGDVVSAVAGLAGQLPLFVVLIGGFVFAMTRRHRDPRAATFVVIGMVAAFLSLLITTTIVVLAPFVPSIVQDLDVSSAAYGTIIGVVNVIASLLAAAGWAMAIVALFLTRKPAPPTYGGTVQ